MNKGFLKNSYIIPINIDVYNTDVIFIYNMGNKKIKKKLKEIIKHEYHEKLKTLKLSKNPAVRGSFISNDPIKIIKINKANTLEDFLSILSHEVLHSVFHIMKNVSIEYTDKSEEAFTYLMGHITKEIVHAIEQE